MPRIMKNKRELCVMTNCNNRILAGKGFRIGAPSIWPYFKHSVGSTWTNYCEDTKICARCNSKLLNMRRTLTLPTPGIRSYTRSFPDEMDTEDQDVVPITPSSSQSVPASIPSPSNDSNLEEYEMNEGSEVTLSSDNQPNSQSFSATRSTESTSTSHQNTDASQNSVNSQHDFPNICACISTQSRCFLCGADSKSGLLSRCRLPATALKKVWNDLNIFIPLKNRCCNIHLGENGEFTPEALNLIRSTNTTITLSNSALYDWINNITAAEPRPGGNFNFCDGGIKSEDYLRLLGVTQANFCDMMVYIEGNMRSTESRSIQNALAMFLMFMKTGCSQDHIGYCFGVDQKIVSNAITSVADALSEYFVDLNLGVGHVSQEDYIRIHSRETFSTALSLADDTTLIVADGTYLFIEKPSDISEQKATYSGQKKRNFLRYMVIVLPSGHILDAVGPFEATKSDSDVISDVLTDELMDFLGPSPNILVDRGFVRCKGLLESKGFTVFDPAWMAANETQLKTQDGNNSRLVTMSRWVIEAAFGRIKQKFRLFLHSINGRYSKDKITKFFRIACSILNRYYPVGFNETSRNVQYAKDAVQRSLINRNAFQELLEADNAIRLTRGWKKIDETSVADFPRLSVEELEKITLGPYQLRVAKKYVREHIKEDGKFELRSSDNHEGGYVRAQIHSRFSGQKVHSAFIKYDAGVSGTDSILAYYCSCRAGARVVGCCAHISTILRFLSHDRYVENMVKRKVNRGEFYHAELSNSQCSSSSDVAMP